ncbi:MULTISPECIES: TlpA family protein disulfide reductase [Winogradskyella]|uniref:TlpA family protein disulfide reductase n=1 Tax=Winogradskyella TaxID=286104 RepID=UPI0015C6A86C|nr:MULTISPECIES: TlpA disulfide reductase family protein [Winogradskyella]QXP79014.1 TlpA family protein disulfide reductase [Winogradskyella sp. HaHa_3_26]
MKKIFYLLSILILSSCAKEEKEYAEITINLDNTDFIEVSNPLEDIYIWDIKNDTIYPNEKNEFLFKKEIESPEYIIIKIGEKRLKSVLIPNAKIELAYIDSSFVFKGKNKAGMNLLNEFKRPYFDVNESSKYQSDTTSFQITQKIKTQKDEELNKLQNLIDSTKIEKRFAKVLEDEINYFYALKTQQIILGKQYQKIPIKKDLLELFNKTLENYPLDNEYKTSVWLDYADNVLLQKPLYELQADSSITRDSIQKWYKNDKWIPFQFDLINKYQNPKIAEKVSANYIMNASKQKHFEKSLISTFNNFKDIYPNSLYSNYLKPEIQIIEDYYRKISGEMPNGVEFIDGKNISSMEKLLDKLQGDNYYVDVWATWCGPCKKEFQHNEDLNVLLKSKGYKKLYISLDKAEIEDKWKQDIKYYDLNGLHMLASQEFFKHFAENYTLQKGYVSIPQYLIIDENGNIVTHNAPRPSNLTELEKILTE